MSYDGWMDDTANITNMIPNEVVRLGLWPALKKGFEMLLHVIILFVVFSILKVIFNFTVQQLNPVKSLS